MPSSSWTRRVAATAIGLATTFPVFMAVSEASAAPNICVSANGRTSQHGTANCESTSGGNVAIARGDNASASATNGTRNRATATGTDATAIASNGNNNTATASGAGTQVFAGNGDNNKATAIQRVPGTDPSIARASDGNNNTATAISNGGGTAQAVAVKGNNNTATATSNGTAESGADASYGNNNTATATSSAVDSANAFATTRYGDNNTAVATNGPGIQSQAIAGGNSISPSNNNSAICTSGGFANATGGTTVVC